MKIGEQEIWFSTLTLFSILLTLDNLESWNITRVDNVPSNLRYIKCLLKNVMSNNKRIVFASILGVILAIGILALNPSMIGNAQAQSYGYNDQYSYEDNYYKDDNRYGYDNKHPKKNSDVNIQKIKCVNSNVNVNGIDITQIPQEPNDLATAANEATNEDGVANTQNGNGFGDRINFDRNLVNVCANVNSNDQTKVEPLDQQH